MANQGKVKRRNQVRKCLHGGMQLVLCEDVPHLGKQRDVVEVKPGYGRNYLVPRGLAVVPTEHNLRLLERHKVRVQQAREARIADLKALAEQIAKMAGITIEANANDEGHLRLDQWTTQEGQKRNKLLIVVDNVQFLERRSDSDGPRPSAAPRRQSASGGAPPTSDDVGYDASPSEADMPAPPTGRGEGEIPF